MRSDYVVQRGLRFVERDEAEWELMWSRLPDDNTTMTNVRSGERWQYMCSVPRQRPSGRVNWYHEFRHRDHPVTRQREVVKVPASLTWSGDHQWRTVAP